MLFWMNAVITPVHVTRDGTSFNARSSDRDLAVRLPTSPPNLPSHNPFLEIYIPFTCFVQAALRRLVAYTDYCTNVDVTTPGIVLRRLDAMHLAAGLVRSSAVQCSAVQCSECSAVQCSAVQCSVVLCSVV